MAARQNSRSGSSQPLTQSALKPAAIYTRQSRTDDSKKDKQKRDHKVETTLETQAAACKRAAISAGYSVSDAAVFSERYTGAEMWDRPILSELRRQIKARDYKALFVYSTDRLARDPIHLALILEECERAGCELVFVTEPIEKSPEGELILYIKGYAAKIERLRIKDRMARGRNAIIAAGKLTCQGNPPYGYKFDPANRVRVVDPETAPIVRDIFRWTIEGLSCPQIKDRLISLRLPCPATHHGKKFKAGDPIWNVSAVARILADDSYTGITYVNKTKVTDERLKSSGKHLSKWLDKKDWKTLPDGVTPAIISREVFDAAREQVIKHRRKSDYTRNSLRPVLLRGLVFCGQCGAAMYPMSETTHKIEPANRPVYKCSDSRRKPVSGKVPCKAKRLIAADLEHRVWNKLAAFFLDPKTVQREVEKVLSSTPDDGLERDLASAETQLEKIKRVREAALNKYEEAIADEDDDLAARWDSKAKEANSDVRALADVIKNLKGRLAAYNSSGKVARAFAKQCKQIMGLKPDTFSFEEKRAALEALAVRVFALHGQPITIQLNTSLLTEQQIESNATVEVTA